MSVDRLANRSTYWAVKYAFDLAFTSGPNHPHVRKSNRRCSQRNADAKHGLILIIRVHLRSCAVYAPRPLSSQI